MFKARTLLFLIIESIALIQCSKSAPTSSIPDVSYGMVRTATNTTTNSLYIKFVEPKVYTFKISGEGFEADVNFDERLPVQDSVTLTFKEEGTYSLNLVIYAEDGAILIDDVLSWEYSRKAPPTPVISFSEEATNDADIIMLTQLNLEESVKELWVEGTVANKGWYPIVDGAVSLAVTPEDGLKTFRVKYRNIYGSESELVNLSLLKKSIGPVACEIRTNTTVTGTGKIVVYLSATNDGKLYYLVSGDAAGTSTKWKTFEGETNVDVTIIDETKPNIIRVQLRDIAGNFCPEEIFSITYDENHEDTSIAIDDGLIWTDDQEITALPQIDRVPSDVVEMYIHGDIEHAADTFTWIPYAAFIDVELTPVDGNRFVRVKYRVNGEESAVKSAPIYLKPFIHVVGSSSPYTLSLSEIVGLTDLSITGCTEAYNHVAPVTSLVCHPTGLTVSVTYYLKDGSFVTRSDTI